jgi:hypothetical protein
MIEKSGRQLRVSGSDADRRMHGLLASGACRRQITARLIWRRSYRETDSSALA